MSKTLLLLGGSEAQVAAIEAANRMGLRTVLCDYLPDNPGRELADSFYQVSTTDMEAVLEVALCESVDGVVAFGSDPAAPTAAYVSQKLKLPGNSYESVSRLCDKSKFRRFLADNGFKCPSSITLSTGDAEKRVRDAVLGMSFPLVVKPVDSSGSKGVSVADSVEDVEEATLAAFRCSRSGRVIIEEFVRAGYYGVVEGEVFVVNGAVRSWGLMHSVRGRGINPLVPTVSIHPPRLPKSVDNAIRCEVERLVRVSRIMNGPMNIEMVIDPCGDVCFIDVGPRNGGNMLAQFYSLVSGKDIVGATIAVAMGADVSNSVDYDGRSEYRWVQHILGSPRAGVFGGLRSSYERGEHLIELHLYKKPGDRVAPFDNAGQAIGIAFLKFPRKTTDDEITEFLDGACVVEASGFELLGGGLR